MVKGFNVRHFDIIRLNREHLRIILKLKMRKMLIFIQTN